MSLTLVSQGAEARIYETTFLGVACVMKERFAKTYRHPELDKQLRVKQLGNELRSVLRCSRVGIRVPAILWVDKANARCVGSAPYLVCCSQ
jgi:TP53 regulating kinase-like protein